MAERPDNMVTIIGPSKTESLSGFRLGAAFGNKDIILRMEKLQAIVSLRAAGYSQAGLGQWFNEPEGFMAERILAHQKIRDDLMERLMKVDGVSARKTEGGSYLFVKLPSNRFPIFPHPKNPIFFILSPVYSLSAAISIHDQKKSVYSLSCRLCIL